MSLMYDAAYGQTLDLPDCRRRGAIAISHYVTGQYATTSPQPAAIRAAGMGALLNWERTAGALVGLSRFGGQAIGREFLNVADPACPQDGTVAGYFSVDVDVAAGNLDACDQAFLGIDDVLRGHFRTAVYGEGDLIDHLVSSNILHGKHWLSMSEGFGGFNAMSPNVCVVQMHDAAGNWIGTDLPATDRNTVTDPYALNAWWNDGSPYTQQEAADMTPDQAKQLDDLHSRLAKFDIEAYQIGATTPAIAAIRAQTQVLAANVTALQNTVAALKDQIGQIPAGVLTDPQVAAIAAAIQAKLPVAGFSATLDLTPKA